MANVRPLVLHNNGYQRRVANVDTLIVGDGVTTTTGSLTINGAGDVNVISNSTTVLVITGTGVVVQAGVTLSTTGTGNINLPNNASARFQIAGSSVSSNVTAANLNTLTAGAASNADALHTHAGLGGGNTLTGVDTTAMTGGAGTFAYMSAAMTASPTDSAALSTSRMVGVYEGTSGSLTTGGVITNAKFTTAGGSPTVGSAVFLAAASDDTNTGAGKLTATAPSSGVVLEAGICLDASNYAGGKTCSVLLQTKSPIVL